MRILRGRRQVVASMGVSEVGSAAGTSGESGTFARQP